jgi:hypothetical protein
VLAIAVLGLTGCGAADGDSTSEPAVTLRLVIADGNVRPPDVPCTGAGGSRYAHPEAPYVVRDASGRVVASGELPQGRSEAAWNLDLGERRQPTLCVMMVDVSGLESVAGHTFAVNGRPPDPIRPNVNLDDVPEVVLR